MMKPIAWALFGFVAVVVVGVFALGLDGGHDPAGWTTLTALVAFAAFAVFRRLVRGRDELGGDA
jgi:hypothetical protein